jgi:hypothetical protein
MRFIGKGRGRLVAAAVAVLTLAGVGISVAASTHGQPPSNAVSKTRGIGEYGMTRAFFRGGTTSFTYTKGYYCDALVGSTASTRCEAGANFRKPPARDFDPLYITVPLGFTVRPMMMDCPDGLVCVDHPGTIDLSRLEPALKPLYPTLTDAQLTAALQNAATPGHNHFITTKAGSTPEWWDVRVVGVTDRAVYRDLNQHKSAGYLLKQVKAGKTTGVIPTNLFLFFGVK